MWLIHVGQYEEMKKKLEDLEDELQRERSAHRHYKRECTALKDEYNNLRLKVRVIRFSLLQFALSVWVVCLVRTCTLPIQW